MNSGCYGEDISQILLSVQVMDLEGKIRVIKSSELLSSVKKISDLDFILANISLIPIEHWKIKNW